MKRKCRFFLPIVLFVLAGNLSKAQIDKYEYRAPILQAKKGWNAIDLPAKLFNNASKDLSDIRLYAPKGGFEIEVPYFIDIQTPKQVNNPMDVKIINPTHTNDLHSYTLELSNTVEVNKIHLDIGNRKFDWELQVDGSMDQNNWSTLVQNQKVISLNNKELAFRYTNITIPTSKFNFYKISFRTKDTPELKGAHVILEEIINSNLVTYSIQSIKSKEHESTNRTIIELDLGRKVPISQINIIPNEEEDYYRRMQIMGMTDSMETEVGWNFMYRPISMVTLNSVSKNEFSFTHRLVQKLKLSIYNFNDQPLSIDNFVVKGPNHRLITKLDETENLQLVYGNADAKNPIYDISYFIDKIPDELNQAKVGEIKSYKKAKEEDQAFFKNKWWLWGIIIIVIALLGTFSIKMLKEESS